MDGSAGVVEVAASLILMTRPDSAASSTLLARAHSLGFLRAVTVPTALANSQSPTQSIISAMISAGIFGILLPDDDDDGSRPWSEDDPARVIMSGVGGGCSGDISGGEGND